MLPWFAMHEPRHFALLRRLQCAQHLHTMAPPAFCSPAYCLRPCSGRLLFRPMLCSSHAWAQRYLRQTMLLREQRGPLGPHSDGTVRPAAPRRSRAPAGPSSIRRAARPASEGASPPPMAQAIKAGEITSPPRRHGGHPIPPEQPGKEKRCFEIDGDRRPRMAVRGWGSIAVLIFDLQLEERRDAHRGHASLRPIKLYWSSPVCLER
jgi:hypothetical protein